MKILFILCIITCFSRVVNSENFDRQMMARSCEMLTRGVHADRDPLDEKSGRASRLFDLTYSKGHTYADQIEGVSRFNLEIAESEDEHFIDSVPQLQAFASSPFNVDFLASLDASLNQSLNVGKWTHLKSPQFGFTYSNRYKYQRDQISKGGCVLHKVKSIKLKLFWCTKLTLFVFSLALLHLLSISTTPRYVQLPLFRQFSS